MRILRAEHLGMCFGVRDAIALAVKEAGTKPLTILGDLVQCGMNCFHSLPPVLYDLGRLKREWGHKLAFCGNVDLNILGRGSQEDARRAVREVKKVWAEDTAGGILLSSSNSIANFCRLENYLAMMDEMLA